MANSILVQIFYTGHDLSENVLSFFFTIGTQTGNLIKNLLALDEFHYLVDFFFSFVYEYLKTLDDMFMIKPLSNSKFFLMRFNLLFIFLSHHLNCKGLLLVCVTQLEALVDCGVHSLIFLGYLTYLANLFSKCIERFKTGGLSLSKLQLKYLRSLFNKFRSITRTRSPTPVLISNLTIDLEFICRLYVIGDYSLIFRAFHLVYYFCQDSYSL